MKTKEVGIRIRVEKDLREAFQAACLAEQRRASDVLREFMRIYALNQNGGLQRALFSHASTKKIEQNNHNE
jgi:hypothetical protein